MKKALFILIAFLNILSCRAQDLPLVITRAKYQNNEMPVVFLISGDGGWYKFEQSIADSLAVLGIPTIGLDIKKYFHEKRTPEGTASDIARAIGHNAPLLNKDHILFIGYSLGAEILPFVVNRLPEDLKKQVKMYVLLSPAATTDFSIHVADLLGMQSKYDTYKVIEEIKKNRNIPCLCIFGSDEKTNVPVLLRESGTMISIIPGDHHYGHDTPLIIKTMKEKKAF